ncbi:hypothetical protein LTS18_009108, partial [Coniosporium uncinatum]
STYATSDHPSTKTSAPTQRSSSNHGNDGDIHTDHADPSTAAYTRSPMYTTSYRDTGAISPVRQRFTPRGHSGSSPSPPSPSLFVTSRHSPPRTTTQRPHNEQHSPALQIRDTYRPTARADSEWALPDTATVYPHSSASQHPPYQGPRANNVNVNVKVIGSGSTTLMPTTTSTSSSPSSPTPSHVTGRPEWNTTTTTQFTAFSTPASTYRQDFARTGVYEENKSFDDASGRRWRRVERRHGGGTGVVDVLPEVAYLCKVCAAGAAGWWRTAEDRVRCPMCGGRVIWKVDTGRKGGRVYKAD